MDVTTDVLIAGSMRAAQVRRVVERGEAISMNRSAKSPVLLVWHNSGNPAVASADRWVVAVTGEKASARSVLCTAMAEAALRDAAVMVLTPAPWDPRRLCECARLRRSRRATRGVGHTPPTGQSRRADTAATECGSSDRHDGR